MNAAQHAAIEEYGPFNDAEAEAWETVQHIWKVS